jgi:hypothetical protein
MIPKPARRHRQAQSSKDRSLLACMLFGLERVAVVVMQGGGGEGRRTFTPYLHCAPYLYCCSFSSAHSVRSSLSHTPLNVGGDPLLGCAALGGVSWHPTKLSLPKTCRRPLTAKQPHSRTSSLPQCTQPQAALHRPDRLQPRSQSRPRSDARQWRTQRPSAPS